MVALATLMYEILLTRIFSVTMYYHFAFVAISIAMFGMTVGSLIVYLLPRVFTSEATDRHLAASAVALPVVMVLSFLTQLSIPFLVHPSVVALYAIVLTYVVIALPFVVSGICVSLALTRYPLRVSQLYAADLIGAAVGCVLLIVVLEWVDGPTAVVVVAVLACLGGLAFSSAAGTRRLTTIAVATTVVLVVGAAANTALAYQQLALLRLLYVKGALESRPLYEKWNSYSRIRVNGQVDEKDVPYGWGMSSTFPKDRLVSQLKMDIDVNAGTVLTRYSGQADEIDHLKYDVTNIGYYIRPHGEVLVVGTGGGRDILSALAFGATRVTGVEINKVIIETVNGRFGDFTGHLDRDPRVRFVNDEARSYIARHPDRYDMLQLSLIDTWAATAAGAFVLSENALYTVEAWKVFLNRLTPTGVLSVSRWYFDRRPGEVYRILTLAAESLKGIGITNPRPHVVVIRSVGRGQRGLVPDGVGTLLVSPTPFSASDLDTLDAEVARLGFKVVLSPRVSTDPVLETVMSGTDLAQLLRDFPINIEAPTDNSPFFFQMLRVRDFFRWNLLDAGKQSANMAAVFILGALLFAVVLLSGLCIVVPLWMTSGSGVLSGHQPLLAYFGAIGLGFMLVETSQMQRLIVVLGHPTYGLSVVLFALLVSSGIGSFFSRGIGRDGAPGAGTLQLTLLLVVLGILGLVTPAITGMFAASATPVRIAVSVLVLAPAGFLMGMAFPLGMKLASRRAAALSPWLWGVNGALSVCASVLAVVISLSLGISAAYWTGFGCYAAALIAFRRTVAA